MPSQDSLSKLIKDLGGVGNKALQQARGKEIQHDQAGSLPAGVEGVAQLRRCRFQQIAPGKTNAGAWQFYADATVMDPEEFTDSAGNTHRVAGKLTQVSELIMDTPSRSRKTKQDHMNYAYNQVGLLLGIKNMEELGSTFEEVVAL